MNFIKDIYKQLGFDNIWVKLATRPDSEFRIGDDSVWDKAEGMLVKAATENNIKYEIAEGDATFYGPKLDIYLKDSMGRTWQNGTIQVDMNLPERFDLSYIDEKGEKKRPIMLHRALLGSIERFMGVLLEHTGGHLPLWLSPEPVVVAPVSEKHDDYVRQVVAELNAVGVRARADLRAEKVNYKIRELSLAKTPLIVVVGEKEAADRTVTIRYLGEDAPQESKPLTDFARDMAEKVKMPG